LLDLWYRLVSSGTSRSTARTELNRFAGRSIVVRTLTALVAAIVVAAPAGSQTANQHLEAVRNLLRDTSAPPDEEAAKRFAALQQDFTEFASEYLMQDSSRAAPEPAEPAGAARQASWRTRYLLVEADLTALLGPADAPVATSGTPRLDPELRDRLQQIRMHLQTFYAATIQAREGNPVALQTPPPVRMNPDAPDAAVGAASVKPQTAPQDNPAVPPTVGIDPATALALLDRIQSILERAAKGESPTSVAPIGTSGTTVGKAAASGKVTLDRALFDEIRADLTQIRALVKK
jgi:hypothetical protein